MINKKIIYVYRFPKNWDERTSKSPIHYFFFFFFTIYFLIVLPRFLPII